MLQTSKPITTVLLCVLLTACGGGGGSDGATTASKESTGTAGLSQSSTPTGSSNGTATGNTTIPSGNTSSNSNPLGNTAGNASTSPSSPSTGSGGSTTPSTIPPSGGDASGSTSGSGSNSGSSGSTTPAQPVARLIVPYSAFNNGANGNVAGSENGLLFVASNAIIDYVDQQGTTGTAVPVIPSELMVQYRCSRRFHRDGPYPCFENAAQMELDAAGNLYVTDWGLIRKVTPDRSATTIARFYPSNGSEPSPRVTLSNVALDSAGNVFVAVNYTESSADYPGRTFIRKIATDGTISDAIPNFPFNKISAIRIDSAQNMYINEGGRILKWSPDGIMTVVANLTPVDPNKTFYHSGLALDSKGNIYVNQIVYSTDNSIRGSQEYRILKVTSDGTVSAFMENKLIAGNLIGPDTLPANDFKTDGGLNNLYAVTLP